MSNRATANTAPELKPSNRCSRSRNRMAAVPPSPVEIKVTKARSTGANRMGGSCSEFDSDRQIKRREPDVRSRRCYNRGEDTKMWRTKWMLTLLLVAGVLFGIKPTGTFAQGGG